MAKYIYFKQVQYENFKNTTKLQTIEFENNGLYLIVGAIGTGKSTKFDAVAAGLFRKIKTSDGILKLSDLINENISKDLYIKVTVEIEENGSITKYDIITTYNHREEKDRIIINDNVDEPKKFNSVLEQVQFIEANIISFDVYYNILSFAQQSNDTFLGQTDANQKRLFDSIIDLKYFDNLREKVKIQSDKLASNLSLNEIKLQGNKNQIQEYLKFIDQKKQQIESEKIPLFQQLENLNHSINQFDLEFSETQIRSLSDQIKFENEIKTKQVSDLENQKNIFSQNITITDQECNNNTMEVDNNIQKIQDDLTTKIGELKNIYQEEFLKFKSEKDNVITNLEKDKQEQLVYLSNLEIQKKNKISKKTLEVNKLFDSKFQNNLQNFQNNKSNLEKNIMVYKSKLTNLQYEKMALNKTIKSIKEALQIDGKCPLCLQPITKDHKPSLEEEISKLENQIVVLDRVIDEIENTINLVTQDILKIQNDFQKYSDNLEKEKSSQIESFTKEIESEYHQIEDNTQLKINSLDNQIKEIQSSIDKKYLEIKTNLDSIILEKSNQSQKEIQNLEKKKLEIINKYNKIKQKYQQSLDTIQFQINQINTTSNDKISQLENNLQKIQNQIKEHTKIKNHKALIEQNLALLDNQIIKLEKDISSKIKLLEDQNNKLSDVMAEDKQTSELLKFWLDALSPRGIKSYIISSITPFINKELSDIMKDIFGERFQIKIHLTQNEKGDLKIKPELTNLLSGSSGYKKQSGGEKRIIDFAILLSMNKLYKYINETTINIMLLDEFFDALDDDSSQLILSMLKVHSKETGIYIISHNEGWKSYSMFDTITA